MTKDDFYVLVQKELNKVGEETDMFNWDNIWEWVNENYEPKKKVSVEPEVKPACERYKKLTQPICRYSEPTRYR